MSDDNSTRFNRLGNANYPEWAMRMEAVLTKKGLWSSVVEILVNRYKADGEEKSADDIKAERERLISRRDVNKMAEARAEMILRVEDGQLSHMTSRDPMVIWENLRMMHQAAGFATSLSLRRKFLTAKKDDDETMEAWIGRIQTMVLRMEHAAIAVTDQDKILAFTMGLPPAYSPVIINFDATSPDQLTVDHVITRLLNEEARQNASPSSGTPSTVTTAEFDEAMAVVAARRASADVSCFFCDKKGHFKSNCPEKSAWEAAKRKKNVGTAALAIGLDSDSDSEAW